MKFSTFIFFIGWCCVLTGCDTTPPEGSPAGYDLGAPQKFVMSEDLHEISGIALLPGNDDSIYAIEDEDGKLFHLHVGERNSVDQKFAKHGDYEDLAVMSDKRMVVLKSDGTLYLLPPSFLQDGNRDSVRQVEGVLPDGEYEGAFGDKDGSLVVLCKSCPQDDQKDGVSGYVLRKTPDGGLAVASQFNVDVSHLKLTSIRKKVKFHPSCLARHPITGEWYIISSVNKILLVCDDQWKIKASYRLNVNLFKQPEGLAFDSKGNMFISNEGDEGDAHVLQFGYHPGKVKGKRK